MVPVCRTGGQTGRASVALPRRRGSIRVNRAAVGRPFLCGPDPYPVGGVLERLSSIFGQD